MSSSRSIISVEEEYDVPIGIGSAFEAFTEKDEVIEILKCLPDIFQDTLSIERSFENYSKLLDRYQEQPHLIDPCLHELVDISLDTFRSATSSALLPLRHLSLKYLKHIFKVRGRKYVMKRMPHEISELVPVLEFLESLDLEENKVVDSAYILCLWLSILVINPFSLQLLDGVISGSHQPSVAQRLMDICFKTIVLRNQTSEAGSVLLANFLTRPDAVKIYMDPFIEWAIEGFRATDFGFRAGTLRSLATLFKHGRREEILPYAKTVLRALMLSKFEKEDTTIRKLSVKLLQRIGQTFLKTKIAPWRYERGSRSLLNNLQGKMLEIKTTPIETIQDDQNDYVDLQNNSEEIEKILDSLLNFLKDKDTVVRWSAAKGIGRVTNRLPKDYGDDVVESVLGCFNVRESYGTWHGGCLALAELARRGLLLPNRLPVTVSVVQKALFFDEIRGNFAVGSNVRDAACYVVWAFARAFNPSVLAPFVLQLAPSLTLAMLFDREINCRRAASAAFQENVGRQGNFPRGIDIVTIADFFSVGIRANAFTKISRQIANYPEYVRPMVEHLLTLKLPHFDPNIRQLAGEALGKLVDFDFDYLRSQLALKLLPGAISTNTPIATGSLVAICQIVKRLSKIGRLELTAAEKTDIRQIVPKIRQKQFAEQPQGHNLIREEVIVFIRTMSEVKFPAHDDKDVLQTWYEVLQEHVLSLSPHIRLRASEAFPIFLQEYYYADPFKRGEIKRVLDLFCENLESTIITTRLGHLLVLGKLPSHVLRDSFTEIIKKLCKYSKVVNHVDKDWAETRQAALVALTSIISSTRFIPGNPNEVDWRTGIPLEAIPIDLLFDTLTEALEDYTTDRRGDIGSWVRHAAMDTIFSVVTALQATEEGQRILRPGILSAFVGKILKQSVEKIDNVRIYAALIFLKILHFYPPFADIPERDELSRLFPEGSDKSINWRKPQDSFPKLLQILPFPAYTYTMLSGLILGEELVPCGGSIAVAQYLNSIKIGSERVNETLRISDLLLEIFKSNLSIERITIPLMQFLTHLLQSGLMSPIVGNESSEFGLELVRLVKEICGRTTRIERTLKGVELLTELLQGHFSLVKAAMTRLMIFLCHAFPRVRAHTATKLYEALLTYGTTLEDEGRDIGTVMTLLSETDWTHLTTEELRPFRNQICELLQIPIITLPTKLTLAVTSTRRS